MSTHVRLSISVYFQIIVFISVMIIGVYWTTHSFVTRCMTAVTCRMNTTVTPSLPPSRKGQDPHPHRVSCKLTKYTLTWKKLSLFCKFTPNEVLDGVQLSLSVLRQWFCCCWFIVYCCSHCLLGFCVWSVFCFAVLSVLSYKFAIILMGKRELVALLQLSSWCLVTVNAL